MQNDKQIAVFIPTWIVDELKPHVQTEWEKVLGKEPSRSATVRYCILKVAKEKGVLE